MKKIILFILSVFALTFNGMAQQPSSREKIEAAKIGFISERLALTPKQAQTFWPMYNEYSAKKKDIRKAIKQLKIENNDNETDSEILEDIRKINFYKQKEVDIEKEYVEKFLTVLSPKQLADLYKAEKQFTKILLDKLKDDKM
jgi:hypothetical protein